MRTIINFAFALVSLASVTAVACPNLSGEFVYTTGARDQQVTWLLKVTQNGCASVTYTHINTQNPNAVIRDQKDVGAPCFVYDIDPNTPGDSCFSYRWIGNYLVGETFDRDAEGMPWMLASQLRITRAPNGNLTEELFEGRGGNVTRTAGWMYELRR